MLPNRAGTQALPQPPGIIGSLRAGFDTIAGHIGLILMPLALDLLLWLGPRFSVSRLMQPVVDQMTRLAPGAGLPQTDVDAVVEMYGELLQRINLLAVLRTLPVGLSSLMSGRMPIQTPMGSPLVVQVDSLPALLGLIAVLTVVGWTLGALYFQRVAWLTAARNASAAPAPAGRAIIQTFLYSLIWVVLIWSIGLPALFLAYLVFAINSVLGQIMLLFLGFVALWLLVPLFFSPHGIYIDRQPALVSFLKGFRLARFTLPTSSLFVLCVFLVGMGLNALWAVPAENTWIVIVGLLGHAFITTALLAASFVYYEDMSAWVEAVLARLRGSLPTDAA